MDIKNKRLSTHKLRTVGICVIALYFSLSFVYSDFSISAVWGALLFCACAGISFLAFMIDHGWKGQQWTLVDAALLLLFVTVLVNFLRVFSMNRTIIYYLLIMFASFLLYWTGTSVSKKHIFAVKWILIGIACLFSLLQVVYMISPNTVRSTLFSVLSSSSEEYNTVLSWYGYGFALGEDIGYTIEVIAVGVGLLSADMTMQNWKSRLPLLCFLFFGVLCLQRRGELLVCLVGLMAIFVCRIIRVRRMGEAMKPVFVVAGMQLVCIVLAVTLFFSLATTNRLRDTGEVLENALTVQSDTSELDNEAFDQEGELDKKITNQNIEYDDKNAVAQEGIEKIGNGRLALWRLAWNGFKDKPLFGNGWGSYAGIAPESGNTHATNAHCVYLQLLCETGIVGFIMVGAIFLSFLLLMLRKLDNCWNAELFTTRLFALYIIVFMLTDGAIDNSLYQPHWILLLTLALMIAFRTEEAT